ncbi:glycosyltransferase 87 family protein [Tsukamurella pseudospumae]|nr:glycosyltransferase 87 family protein [Tsukamurella pseudospumae]
MPSPMHHLSSAISTPRRRVAAAAALLVAATVIGLLLNTWHGFLDLLVYRLGARTWLDGGALYGQLPPIGDIALPFTYPPLAAIAFAPLAMLPEGAAGAVMFALSLGAIGLTLWLVLARVRPSMDRGTRLAIVLAGTALAEYLEPVRQTLGFGQVNALLMAAIAADVLARNPRWPRGLLIGIAISIKLTPAGFLLLFLLHRDWRALATSIAGAAGSVALAWAVMPDESRQYWFHTLKETSRIGPPYFAGNQSIKGMVFRLGFDKGISTALWLALSLVAVALAAVWMRRLLADGALPVALMVNAAAVLLISPVSWSHHWVWVAPALLLGVLAIADGARGAAFRRTVAFATVLFYIGPHWLLPSRSDRELAWAWWQQIIGSSYVLFTVAVLAAGAWSVRRHTDDTQVTVSTNAPRGAGISDNTG